MKTFDPIKLEVYKNLLASVAEEMGAVLQKSSFSPNIKERRDFSCALFDKDANLIAQAAHIPVHLGAMPLSVKAAINALNFQPGDAAILNDPYQGGTHLPDITIISPLFNEGEIFAYVASRAHHADVGGMTPGSMPIAREIFQEGLIIPPVKILEQGEINQSLWQTILANVRTPIEREGDLRAQLAANHRGIHRLQSLLDRYGKNEIDYYFSQLLAYTERVTRHLIRSIPDGKYSFVDYLDNDGISDKKIKIKVSINIQADKVTVDFSGSTAQAEGSVNAVFAITLSAVYYVFRCLLPKNTPNNHGILAAIEIIAPKHTVVNASRPAPVSGGNVETSQRIVDVLLGALAQALPNQIPAASQGTMNNTLIGGWDPIRQRTYTYYETIGGGSGGGPAWHGKSAVHTHMTNTLNTPVEALEYTFPFTVEEYSIRKGTGGDGLYHGGDGITRSIRVHTDAQVSLLTDRRIGHAYGLSGGEQAELGVNLLIRNGEKIELPAKGSFDLKENDILQINTPGGGGFGKVSK